MAEKKEFLPVIDVRNMEQMAEEIAKQTQEFIFEKLGDLVKKGLLVVEVGPYAMVQESGFQYRYSIKREVKFHLKDKEYIENLERENQFLKDRLYTLKKALGDDTEL